MGGAEDLIEHNVALAVRKPPAVKRPACSRRASSPRSGTLAAALGGYGRLVRFLALTGQRRGEAAGLRHGDILDAVWRQSADSNKAQRAHAVPLFSSALALVGQGEPQEHSSAKHVAARSTASDGASGRLTSSPASPAGACTICAARRRAECRISASVPTSSARS